LEPAANRTFLGVDYGRRRTGLSVSDPDGRLAVPLATLTCRGLDDLAARIAERAREREAACVVLGMPRREDGRAGDLAPEIEDLAGRLRNRGLAVVFWDEQLTSWEAETLLAHAPAAVRRKKENIDALAATLILQSYLESLPR
jgi:putative holliday junction resolvase